MGVSSSQNLGVAISGQSKFSDGGEYNGITGETTTFLFHSRAPRVSDDRRTAGSRTSSFDDRQMTKLRHLTKFFFLTRKYGRYNTLDSQPSQKTTFLKIELEARVFQFHSRLMISPKITYSSSYFRCL